MTHDHHAGILTEGRRQQAARIGVYRVHLYGDTAHGWPDRYVCTVAVVLTRPEAEAEVGRRRQQPGARDYRFSSLENLLALYDTHRLSVSAVENVLAAVDRGMPFTSMTSPAAG